MNFRKLAPWFAVFFSPETRSNTLVDNFNKQTPPSVGCGGRYQLQPMKYLSDLLGDDSEWVFVSNYNPYDPTNANLISECWWEVSDGWANIKYDQTTKHLTRLHNDKVLFESLSGEQQFYVLYSKVLSTLGGSSLHMSSSKTATDISVQSSYISLIHSVSQFLHHPRGQLHLMSQFIAAIQHESHDCMFALKAPGYWPTVAYYFMAKQTLVYLHRPIECVHFLHLSIDRLAKSMLVWDQDELSQYAESIHLLHTYLIAFLKGALAETFNYKDSADRIDQIYNDYYTHVPSSSEDNSEYHSELIQNLNYISSEIRDVLMAKGIGRIPDEMKQFDQTLNMLLLNYYHPKYARDMQHYAVKHFKDQQQVPSSLFKKTINNEILIQSGSQTTVFQAYV